MPDVTPKTLLIFDSGLGGLSVYAAIRARFLRNNAPLAAYYIADDAAFPYGALSEEALVSRVMSVMENAIARLAPDSVVIACNTASTLVLPPLRARWPHIPFIGTVPAIKPAAEQSRSHMVSVLATPGTVSRDYTQALITDFASHCDVTLVGAPNLASLTEQIFFEGLDQHKLPAPLRAAILADITPAFVDSGARRTDFIVLACTHYPLILPALIALSPWPVTYLDPAPAIARRVEDVLAQAARQEMRQMMQQDAVAGTKAFLPQSLSYATASGEGTLFFTSGKSPSPSVAQTLADHHLRAQSFNGSFATSHEHADGSNTSDHRKPAAALGHLFSSRP